MTAANGPAPSGTQASSRRLSSPARPYSMSFVAAPAAQGARADVDRLKSGEARAALESLAFGPTAAPRGIFA